MEAANQPYCGDAPLPAQLWHSWNLDPWLIAALLAAAVLIARGKGARLRLAGLAVFALATISPLCALSSALFSARVAQHMLLVAVAAPLIAAGLRWRPTGPAAVAAAFVAQMATIWVWHLPGPYALALSSNAVYWAMELSLLGSGVWLWSAMLAPGRAGGAIALALGTVIQMGMLGALITFAGRPLYAAHLTTTEPFGLTALQDQQLAGLLMWAPAALPYLGFALQRLLAELLPARRLPA